MVHFKRYGLSSSLPIAIINNEIDTETDVCYAKSHSSSNVVASAMWFGSYSLSLSLGFIVSRDCIPILHLQLSNGN